MLMKLEHKNVWYGKHRGLNVEINNFKFYEGDKLRWTYYVIIDKKFADQIEEITYEMPSGNKKFSSNRVKTASNLENVRWHVGITFLEHVVGGIKIGCDYSHYQDEGRIYELEDIKRDLANTVDDLLAFGYGA